MIRFIFGYRVEFYRSIKKTPSWRDFRIITQKLKMNWNTAVEYKEITGRKYDKPAVSVGLGMTIAQ
ncbi:hypothetical protein BTA30_07565 [Bacillus swezeyi]|uniref:Uncharacterized protein n=1 Tax=Bacillus swezeyi TaxID=1925020 RepID=A0A1R1RZL9_9BACI|nr:hypothetical protein BW143_13700 [Bacillus swezeyi]OMI31456.1 hypothetical protein BTA30_07565 [Bacillus swezeyi]